MLKAFCIRCLLLFIMSVFSASNFAYGTGLELNRSLHLGSWSPFASYWEGNTPVCAWSQSHNVGFRVTALNNNNFRSFSLSNEIGHKVSFSLFWGHFNSPISGEQLRAGTPSAQTYVYNSDNGCGVNPNYMMRLRVDKADLDNAMPGIYSAALVLILSPI